MRKKRDKPAMVYVTLRVPPELLQFYRDKYPEHTTAMRNILMREANMSIDFYKIWMESDERKKLIAESEARAASYAGCEHEYAQETLGRCYNKYTCKKCGYSYEVDSSD